MKISIISKKLVKPLTPTPQNLKNYKISFIDQSMNKFNITVVLFYESKPKNCFPQLEESLARTLVEFYPLAGRYIKNDHLIDCSDQGVEFVEAEALDVELIDLIAKIETEHLKSLFTDRCYLANNQLLSIQVTHFPCGSLAIAISVSHDVFDGSSLATFIAAWSSTTNLDNNQTGGSKITPSFDLPSLLPCKDIDFGVVSSDVESKTSKNMVVKRLLFDKVSVARLRSKLRPNRNGKTISRVRVVCAVIVKALIGADDAKHGRRRNFFISEVINMRGRTIQPQPQHACGNLVVGSYTHVLAASEEREIELQELVDLMSDTLVKAMADKAELLSPHRDGRDIILNDTQILRQLSSDPDTNVMMFSDWSKFGLYEADFGWGNPIWTGIGPEIPDAEYAVILMNNKEGDGIEAWVYLNQDCVWMLEQDEDIKRIIIT